MRRFLRFGMAALSFLAAAAPVSAQQKLSALRAPLEARIAQHHGKVGLAVIDLVTGDSLLIHDGPYPTASLIKLPVLIELFHEIHAGRIQLDDPLVVTEADKVPGSGILQHFTSPHTLTVSDAATLMVVLSDNTATNLIIRKLGIRAVNARMDTLGYKSTRLFAEVFRRSTTSIDPDSSERWGLGVTTPGETADMLAAIYRGSMVSDSASARMLRMLRDQYSEDRIPRFLPDTISVAHKTGEVNATRNDCGVVLAGAHPYVLCVLTTDNMDQTWRMDNEAHRTIADLSRIVYAALVPPDPKR